MNVQNLDIDFTQIAQMGNGVLARLNHVREADPIVWNDSLQGWLVNRHADVMDAFQGKLPLSCIRMEQRAFATPEFEAFAKAYPKTLSSLPYWIVNSDPPRHARLRTLMARAFSRKIVEDLRPFAKETIKETLDGLTPGSEIEFMETVAREITGRVILKKFGLAESNLGRLKAWSFAFNAALGGVRPSPEMLAGVERSITEMDELFIPEIAKRRESPTGDFLSQLVLARDNEDKLSEEEILGICYLVIVAGHDTTLNSMTLGVAALADNPGPRQYMLDHPDQILDNTMEVMRYSAMSTAFNRVAAEDFEWHGKQIKKGHNVWMMTAAANRDPRVYENPEAMDMTRPQDRSTVFGPGIHHCIGHLLAKMQLTEFFPEFFRRFPDTKVLDKELDFQPSLSFRGLNSLHVKL